MNVSQEGQCDEEILQEFLEPEMPVGFRNQSQSVPVLHPVIRRRTFPDTLQV